MFFRVIQRKYLWGFGRRWQCGYSTAVAAAKADGSTICGSTIESRSLYRVQDTIFTKPTILFHLSSLYERSSLSIPFGNEGCYFSSQTSLDTEVGGLVEVPLAQTGEGIAECELLKWFVQEGDLVEEFQPLCEVQSDKATIEITSRYKGKVSEVMHVPGTIVKVGETLLRMLVDNGALADPVSETPEVLKELDPNTSPLELSIHSEVRKDKISGVLSTPSVRGFAKKLGIDIEDVPGTGAGGRISKEDVLNYASAKGILKECSSATVMNSTDDAGDSSFPSACQVNALEFKDHTVSLRGFQRVMAKTMALASRIPHFYYVDEINCDSLIALKESFQNANSDPGVKYSFLPVLIKSLSLALTKYPMLNSSFNEELHEVTVKGSHNIGIAMATPNGLVVPNIKGVQSLSILQITRELSRLQELAMANKLNPEDVSGGTITLSNIGSIGGKFGSPLINVPEASIIAIGRIQKLPRFDEDGEVYPASIMTVNIGADHRILDGATVARFSNEWKHFIEKPELFCCT